MFEFARHNRSAPVATARDHSGNPQNPRSASTSMPGSSRSISAPASVFSAVVYGPTSASTMAWVPHSASADHPSLRERGPLTLVHPGPPEQPVVLRGVGHVQTHPVDRHQPPPGQPRPRRRRRRQRSSDPAEQRLHRLGPQPCRAWKIADFDGNTTGASPDAHANPSVNNANTSSYEPSECSAIPIEKYAIVRAGNDRCRCSVRPASAITSSTSPGGNVRVSTPTDTRSDNRRSDSGFLQPARGTHPNYTAVVLTERYCG